MFELLASQGSPHRLLACAALLLLIPGASLAATGGPDAYGYTYTDSGEAAGPTYAWESGIATLTPPDDGSIATSLPFPFYFYGTAYSSVEVGEDGIVTLGEASPGEDNDCLPEGNSAVMPWWDDWVSDAQGATVATASIGSSPNRVFVVAWQQVENDEGEEGGSFELKLFEGSGVIEFHYADVVGGDSDDDRGNGGTVGIEQPSGGHLEYSCDSASLSNNFAIRFELTSCNDADSDGFLDCAGDCDDAAAAINPAAVELCDAEDNNCDGAVDEGCGDDDDSAAATGDDDDSAAATGDDDDSAAATGDDDDSAAATGDDDDTAATGDDDDLVLGDGEWGLIAGEGCACSPAGLPGSPNSKRGVLLFLALVLGAGLGQRRRRRPRPSKSQPSP